MFKNFNKKTEITMILSDYYFIDLLYKNDWLPSSTWYHVKN